MSERKSPSGLSRTGPDNGFCHSDVPETPSTIGKAAPMKNLDIPHETLQRLPGLFRRWELAEILKSNGRYQIEDARAHADGTPLFAVFESDWASETTEVDFVDHDAPASDDPRSIIPDGLLPRGLASRLPLIIEIEAPEDDEPKMMSLFGPNGATLADLYLAIQGERAIAEAARETVLVLSVLLDRLLAHGANPGTHVCAALEVIARSKAAERAQ